MRIQTTENMSEDFKEIQSHSHHKRAVTMANKEIRAPAIVSIRSELTKSRFAPPKDKKLKDGAAKKVMIDNSISPPRRVSRT